MSRKKSFDFFLSILIFFYQKFLWVQYIVRLMKRPKSTLKRLLNINLYQAEKNLKKFISIAKGFQNPLTFLNYDT